MERKTGFEPATATLARWSSTGLSYFRSRGDCRSGRANSKPRPKSRQAGLDPTGTRLLHRGEPLVVSGAHAPGCIRLTVELQVLPGRGLPGEIPGHPIP